MPMPFSDWIYNSNTGAVNELPTPAAALLLRSGTGWHGPFDNKQRALDFYESNKAANPGWAAPAGIPDQIGNVVEAANPLNMIGGIDIGSWLIRIGEIILGIVLIGVGVAKLTGATNAVAKLVKVAT